MASSLAVAAPPAVIAASAAARWRAYAVCLLGWLFDFYDLMLFAYLAKAIARDFGWGAQADHYKGLLVGLALAASGVGGIVFGGLADRYGRKRIMAATIIIYCLGTGLCGWAGGFLSLAVFRLITGFGVGGEWATGHALMAEMFPKEERGRASALLQAGEPLGVALAVIAGLVLEPRIGWRNVFFLSTLPAFLVVFIRRNVEESPLWLSHKRDPSGDWLGQYKTLARDHGKRSLQGWVLGCSKLGTYWLVYVWLPEYFAELDAAGHSSFFASIRLKFILVAQGGQFAGMLVFGWLSDRLGRRPAFTLYSLLTAAGVTALSLYGAQMLQQPSLFWPAMGTVGFGSGCTAGFGALLAELFPTSVRNTAMGTIYNAARGFQFVTQLIMGYLAASAGVSRGLLLAAGFAVFTACWVWTFPETRGIALRQE